MNESALHSAAAEYRSPLFEWLRAHPTGLLVLSVLCMDAYVMGHAIGFGNTLAAWIDRPWATIEYGRWHSTDVFVLALAGSQLSLLLIWAGFGSSTRTLKLLVCASAVGLWVAAISSMLNVSWAAWSDTTPLLLGQSAVGLLGCALLRRRGYQLQQAEDQQHRSPSRKQFTLEEMFLCLSAAAVLCAACSWLAWLDISWLRASRAVQWYWRNPTEYAWIAGQGAGCALLGCLAAWACLARDRVAIRMALVCAAAGLTAWVTVAAKFHLQMYQGWSVEPLPVGAWLVWFLTQTVMLCGLLLSVRAFGYRLMRQQARAAATPAPRSVLRKRSIWGVFAAVSVTALSVMFLDDARTEFQRYRRNLARVRALENLGTLDGYGGPYRFTTTRPLDAETVAVLRRYPEIDSVHLHRPDSLTASSLRHLKQLPHLRKLTISEASLSPEQLDHIGSMTRLQQLDMHHIHIRSPSGVQRLRGLKSLTQVRFHRTNTHGGISQLEQWFPTATITETP